MKSLMLALCAAVCLAGAQNVMAEAGATEAEAPAKAACASACGSECGCPVSKAMAALPKMTYKVGDEETCCDKTAAKLAKEAEGHIHFVVAGKDYEEKNEAMVALADVTEKFVNEFATPHTCDVSGKTTICGSSMGCEVSAGMMAKKAKAAMKTVALSYQVGEEKCNCPNAAAALAKKTGAEKTFVIGEETTCCEVDARIKLAHAKYVAAVKAIQPAAATATQPEPSQEG